MFSTPDRALPARRQCRAVRARGVAHPPGRAGTAGDGLCRMKGGAGRVPRAISPGRRFPGAAAFPAPGPGSHG
jgi:hypothetical protein